MGTAISTAPKSVANAITSTVGGVIGTIGNKIIPLSNKTDEVEAEDSEANLDKTDVLERGWCSHCCLPQPHWRDPERARSCG